MHTPGTHSAESLYPDLFELTPQAKADFQQHVAGHGGNIHAFVHPLYLQHRKQLKLQGDMADFWRDYYEHLYREASSIRDVQEAFQSAALNATPDRPLLVVFEEGHHIPMLIEQLRGAKFLPYIIPTFADVPTPYVRSSDAYGLSSWGTLRELLRELGVRNVYLGGMFTDLCVRRAFYELQRGFYVEASLALHPPQKELTTGPVYL